ncbi:MAG TPA: Fe-S cluster assembly ATPase SufC [Kiritimatiellia bacterium]|nr:Fe-S cluster assembly ATPase SufC [Kiritimatiellia bacterium]HMP00214.1 Fe-S cluster assembly ATPase SufC [Kiritimatiellia bacterium]HMP96844.1 Fe-S cluster assembly ATPase SufC [Kiritimatiellia bacterium]
MSDTEIRIVNLHARCEEKEILKGVNLEINPGEVHALMGPNGSGKSTLSNVIMGHPSYEVTGGEIWFKGRNILELEPDERARLGLFLAFQYPIAIPGVSVAKFLKSSSDAILGDQRKSAGEFLKELRENLKFLEMNEAFLNRFLNDGFSGGEKKRMEILQMLMLKPSFAVMDETDSGLDIDALRVVSKGVNRLTGPAFSLLVITHYERILQYIKPDHLHVLIDGKVVMSGGPELVKELEEKGYDWIRQQFGQEVLV